MARSFEDHLRNYMLQDAYVQVYPTDNLGDEINPDADFYDLWQAVNHQDGDYSGNGVYKVIGVKDSVVREGLFKILADLANCSYDLIYKTWMGESLDAKKNKKLKEDIYDDFTGWDDEDWEDKLADYEQKLTDEWDWTGKDKLDQDAQLEIVKVLNGIADGNLQVKESFVEDDTVFVTVEEPTEGHLTNLIFSSWNDDEGFFEEVDWAQDIFYTSRWNNYWGAKDDTLEYAIQTARNKEGYGLFDRYLEVAEPEATSLWLSLNESVKTKKSRSLKESAYSQPKVLEKGSEEYEKLERAAKLFHDKLPYMDFTVEDIYFDYGQDWKWTTIVADNRSPERQGEFQMLSPRDWNVLLSATSDKEMLDLLDAKIAKYPRLSKGLVYEKLKESKGNLTSESKELLKKIINPDEQIVAYAIESNPYVVYHFVAPEGDIDRLDLGGCLEDTLHRLLDIDASDNDIMYLTGMEQETEVGDDYENVPVDLGYVIPGVILNSWKEEDTLNESIKEDVRKEWKPNLSFNHIKDVLNKAVERGKFMNNERDEVMAALDKADKGGYTPEQRVFIRDKHKELWRIGRKSAKTESFNKIDAINAILSEGKAPKSKRYMREAKRTLSPDMYDVRKSFYGKASVDEIEVDGYPCFVLTSYNTDVACVYRSKLYRLWDGYSATTMRHINEFAMQYTGEACGKAKWDKMPVLDSPQDVANVKTESFNKTDAINAIQQAYGYSKKKALDYLKTADEKTVKELIRGFRGDAKKSFLSDSLKESKGRRDFKTWKDIPFGKDAIILDSLGTSATIVFVNEDANDGNGSIEWTVEDPWNILVTYNETGDDPEAFFESISQNSEWYYIDNTPRNESRFNEWINDFRKADFINGIDGNDSDELKFLVDWAKSADGVSESLHEDTVKKSNGKWTNRGDDGKEHGEFKTKKAADAQRRAMFANKRA